MAEFHKNQVSWEAPEPGTVSLKKPDYEPLAKAFDTLGRASNEIAQYSQGILDTNARATMSNAVDDYIAQLDKENPSDNNYNPALNRFNQGLLDSLNGYDEATRNRFLRDNPSFFDEANLRAQELVFKKQQSFAIQKAKDTLPLLSSNVTEGKQSYESARKELDDMIANMDRTTQEQMIFAFNRDVQITKIKNLVIGGQYSDAIKYLENPKESSTLSAEERTEMKKNIQDTITKEIKEREAAKKQITKDIDDQTELRLTKTLLYQMDHNDDGYFRTVMLLDQPYSKNAVINLLDDDGKVIGTISAADINPMVRRNALKTARTYEADCMNIRRIALDANQMATNLLNKYKLGQGKRLTGELFNQMYNLQNSNLFYALTDDTQKEINEIIDNATSRYIEQVIPYTNFREDTLLYGVGKKWEGPSPAKMVPDMILGRLTKSPADYTTMANNDYSSILKNISAGVNPLEPVNPASSIAAAVIDTRRKDQEQRWQRQLTSVLRDEYKKENDHEVQYGSKLEYLMNMYSDIIAMNEKDRADIGFAGITDEQLSLTYARMLGVLEASGQIDDIIGQQQSSEEAKKSRDNIFNDFYTVAHNGLKQELSVPQALNKMRLYDWLALSTYGKGATALGFTSTEYTTHEEEKVYSRDMTTIHKQTIEQWRKGGKQ